MQTLMYLLVVFFRVDSLATVGDSSRAVHPASLGWSPSVSTGDHPGQAGCSTDL